MIIKGAFNPMLRERVESLFNPYGAVKTKCQLLHVCIERRERLHD